MLVSCLTPTADRRSFWPQCIQCFQSQDYPELEWVIIDNGADPIKDLLPVDARIRYIRLPGARLRHGALMNMGMERSTGALACVFDDDDWYAPDRVRKLAERLYSPAVDIVGTSKLIYYVLGTQRVFRYVNLTAQRWMAAPAWKRTAWEHNRFDDLPHGADTNFINRIPMERRVDLEDERMLISTIHPKNASPKRLPSPSFVEVPWATVGEIKKEKSMPKLAATGGYFMRNLDRLETLKSITGASTGCGWMVDDVAFLLYSLVKFYKPELVIQTGHLWGKSMFMVLEALTDGFLESSPIESSPVNADKVFSDFTASRSPRFGGKRAISMDPEPMGVPHPVEGIDYLKKCYP